MGCDIHGPEIWAQRKDGAYRQAHRIAILRWQRDYLCFAVLANVRSDGEIEAVSAPRDFPDLTWFTGSWEADRFVPIPADMPGCGRHHLHQYTNGCHSASWLTTAEVALAHRRYVDAAGATSSDMTVALMTMIAAQNAGYEDVRLLFCFDS